MISDKKEDQLRKLHKKYPNVYCTLNYQEILKSKEVDGVVIATPSSTHYALSKEALQADKHVLVEKPLALRVGECEELIKIAKKRKKILMVGHTFLYNAAVQKLKEYIKNGELGRVLYIYSRRLNLGIIRDDLNSMWNFAPHDLAIMVYLLDAEPTKVRAKGYTYLQKNLDDVVFITLDFPNKIGAHLHLSWLDPGKIRQMTVVGSKKMVVYDDVSVDAKIQVYDKGVMQRKSLDKMIRKLSHQEGFGHFQLQTRSGDIFLPKVDFIEPLTIECKHFLDCIINKKTPLSDGYNGLQVVKILEAAQQSLEKDGIPIKIR
jgi:predicted dehydrogenase